MDLWYILIEVNDQEFQFHLEEYKSLKTEIEYRVKSCDRLEYVVVVAMVCMYAWLLADRSGTKYFNWVWWLPVFLPILGAIRQAALLNRIIHIASYLITFERDICKSAEVEGWETFLLNRRKKSIFAKLISISGFLLWFFLLVCSVFIAVNSGFQTK